MNGVMMTRREAAAWLHHAMWLVNDAGYFTLTGTVEDAYRLPAGTILRLV